MTELRQFDINGLGLSRSENAILTCLLHRCGELVTRGELLEVLRAQAPHTIDSHIMEIRRKLVTRGAMLRIETVKGSGFILRTSPAQLGSSPQGAST